MPVYRWTFEGKVQKHLIEIEHIPSTGRLKLFLNGQELLEDEVKKGPWKHYFYIDEELVVAEVAFDSERYAYHFHEDEHHESKRIRRQRVRTRQQITKYILIASGITLLVGLFPYLLFNQTEWYRNVRLNRGEGKLESMTFYWDEVSGSTARLTYVYTFDGERHYGSIDTAVFESYRTPAGMPVWNGDQFHVRLLTDRPSSHVVDLSRESWGTRQRYRERLVKSLQSDSTRLNIVNPEEEKYLHCLLEFVRQQYGIEGWAHIYFRHEPQHASDYKAILESSEYRDAEGRCTRHAGPSDSAGT